MKDAFSDTGLEEGCPALRVRAFPPQAALGGKGNRSRRAAASPEAAAPATAAVIPAGLRPDGGAALGLPARGGAGRGGALRRVALRLPLGGSRVPGEAGRRRGSRLPAERGEAGGQRDGSAVEGRSLGEPPR